MPGTEHLNAGGGEGTQTVVCASGGGGEEERGFDPIELPGDAWQEIFAEVVRVGDDRECISGQWLVGEDVNQREGNRGHAATIVDPGRPVPQSRSV